MNSNNIIDVQNLAVYVEQLVRLNDQSLKEHQEQVAELRRQHTELIESYKSALQKAMESHTEVSIKVECTAYAIWEFIRNPEGTPAQFARMIC